VETRENLIKLFHRHSGVNLAAAIYLTLYDAIAAGLLPHGTKLNEVELAEWFQVSRTPIQKAFIKLECEELITFEHKRGYLIQALDFKQSRDVNEFYLELYTVSMRLAKKRRLDNYYDQLLRTRLGMMEREKGLIPFLYLDYDFHIQIAHSTGNKELINAIKRANDKCYLMFMTNKECPIENKAQYIEKHLALSRRLYDMLLNATSLEVTEFMEEEHNPHMSDLIGAWNQPKFRLE